MRFSNPFSELDRFEWILWISSIIIIAASFLIGGGGNYLTLIASLVGATALIFVAKGRVFGQVMTVVFAVFLCCHILAFQVLRRNDNISVYDFANGNMGGS